MRQAARRIQPNTPRQNKQQSPSTSFTANPSPFAYEILIQEVKSIRADLCEKLQLPGPSTNPPAGGGVEERPLQTIYIELEKEIAKLREEVARISVVPTAPPFADETASTSEAPPSYDEIDFASSKLR
jgi:hypothetical protein